MNLLTCPYTKSDPAQAAKDAQKQAHFHRKIAAELLQREYAKPAEIPNQQGNRTIKVKKNSNKNNL